ncbi:hypothetical protein [Clostridium sp. BSD9I1]|uniref:hypothetical protein n=1 Tax=Clostridium sp. BSD9I1 TaxID=2003589 RepID=UPI0016450403|nr:hypothetical protein [Clostridium sp. BSD9I1]
MSEGSDKINKCILVVIKSCKELECKKLDKTLRDIEYLTCKASNKAMQMCICGNIKDRVQK